MLNRSDKQGFLEIDDNQDIVTYEDRHFGRHYRVKQSRRKIFLFSTPPQQQLIPRLSRGKLVKMGVEQFPAILTMPHGETVGVYTALEKNESFLARELPGHPDILEIVTFDRVLDKEDDMPETGDGIKITLKGYVLKEHAELMEEEKFKLVNGDIFPNKNLVEDIYQNSFGDCFLLASVLSILSQPDGSDYIKGMMRQEGDYTVVRLFNPDTQEPCYIRVKNSDYHRNGRNAVSHQAPWVHILEKAYTAFAYKKRNQESYVSYPAFREIFGNGGAPEFALKILTGRKANRVTIPEPASYPWRKAELMDCLPIYFSTKVLMEELSRAELDGLDAYLAANANEEYLSALIKILAQDDVMDELPAAVLALEAQYEVNPSIIQLLSRIIFESTSESGDVVLRSFASYIGKYSMLKIGQNTPLSQIFNSVREFSEVGQGLFKLMQEDKLDNFFAAETKVEDYEQVNEYFENVKPFEHYFPNDLITKFRRYAYESNPLWNLPLGCGEYSRESLAVYSEIEKKLKEGNPRRTLVASTKTSFTEDKVPGLRNRHAYAIVGVYEKKSPKVKVIKLRNPWGHTGRVIDYDQMRRGEKDFIYEKKENAEFEVELSHFTRYFRDYSVGEFVPPKPRREEVIVPVRQREEPIHQPKKAEKPGFFKRHWGKMLVGGLLIAGLVVAGIFTFGAVPAIAAGVIAGLALAHVTVSVTVATVIGVGAIGLAAAAVGVGAGAAIGAASDKCCGLEERSPRLDADAEARRPLLLPDGDDDLEHARSPVASQRFDTTGINKAISGLPEVEQVSASPAAVTHESFERGNVEATVVEQVQRVVPNFEGSNSSLTF